MSGTSLDGLDLCIANFDMRSMKFEMGPCTTIEYDALWKKRLATAQNLDDSALDELNKEYASWLALQANIWLSINNERVDLIASHGHTILHEPHKGITLQIGNHPELSNLTSLPVICDFRTQDVQLGGQGAPLVPMGDKMLFNQYRSCLNLGGFSNISYNEKGERIAYDISPCNILLNKLIHTIGEEYDRDGKLAKSGSLLPELHKQLSSISFYRKSPPKSLSREWLEKEILPIINKFGTNNLEDILHTVVIHISEEIAKNIPDEGRCLITGGGAYHQFLIQQIQERTNAKIIIPDDKLIQFKEALVFGFLGALKWRNKINVLSSVTGARHDHCSGTIFHPS